MSDESREISLDEMLVGKWDSMTIAQGGEQQGIGMKPFMTTAGRGFDSFLKYISFLYERDISLSLPGSLYDSIFQIPESYGYLTGKGYPLFDDHFIFLLLMDEAGEEGARDEWTRYRVSRERIRQGVTEAAHGRKAKTRPVVKESLKTTGRKKPGGKDESKTREFVENIRSESNYVDTAKVGGNKKPTQDAAGRRGGVSVPRSVRLSRLIRHFGRTTRAEFLAKRNLLSRLRSKSFASIISDRPALLPHRTGKTSLAPLTAVSPVAEFTGGDYFASRRGQLVHLRSMPGDFEFLKVFEPNETETTPDIRALAVQRRRYKAGKPIESPAITAVSGKRKTSRTEIFTPFVFPISARKVNQVAVPAIEGGDNASGVSTRDGVVRAAGPGKSKKGAGAEKPAGGKTAAAILEKVALYRRGKKAGEEKAAALDENYYGTPAELALQTFSLRRGVPSRESGTAAQTTILGFEPGANLPFVESLYFPAYILHPYSPESYATGYGYEQSRGLMDIQPEFINIAPGELSVSVEGAFVSGWKPGLRKEAVARVRPSEAFRERAPSAAVPAKRVYYKKQLQEAASKPRSSGLIFITESGVEPLSIRFPLGHQRVRQKGIPFSLISGGREKIFTAAFFEENAPSRSMQTLSLTEAYHYVPFTAAGALADMGLLSAAPRNAGRGQGHASVLASFHTTKSRPVQGDFKMYDSYGDLIFLIQPPDETAAEIYGATKETRYSRPKAEAVKKLQRMARAGGKSSTVSSRGEARKILPAAFEKTGRAPGAQGSKRRSATFSTTITEAFPYPGKITHSSITKSFPYLPFVVSTGSGTGAVHAAGRLSEPADFEHVLTRASEQDLGRGGESPYISDYFEGVLKTGMLKRGRLLGQRHRTTPGAVMDTYQYFTEMDLVELSVANRWETPGQTTGGVPYIETRRGQPPVLPGLLRHILKSPVSNLQTLRKLRAKPSGMPGAGVLHEHLPTSHPLYEILVGIRGFEKRPAMGASTSSATGGVYEDFDFTGEVLNLSSEDRMVEGRIRKGETYFERILKSLHRETLPYISSRAGSGQVDARGSLDAFGSGERFQPSNRKESLELISTPASYGAGLGTNLASAFSKGSDAFKSAGELPLVTPSIKAVSQTALASRKEPGEQPGGTARTEQTASPGGGGKEGEAEKIDIKTLAMEMAERIMKRLKIEKERRGL